MKDLPERRIDLEFDDNRLLPLLCGQHDSHLARIEAQLGVSMVSRGNRLSVVGTAEAVETARTVLDDLWLRVQGNLPVGPAEVDAAVRFAGAPDHATAQPGDPMPSGLSIRTRRRAISPRSPGQARYLRALQDFELVFATGPAGTGKTYLAVAQAVAMLTAGEVERIILSRPAVEAGERLGFLPGDLREKVDPYLRPLYDALYDMLPAEQVAKRFDSGEIEVAPLAFMRGRTLSHAFVILDEAQNTTPMQMKMFLTRLGDGGRMVVTGDITQVDLGPGTRSGLIDALEILQGTPSVGFVTFTDVDVVRHPLVAAVVRAYDARDAAARADGRAGTGFRAVAR